MPSRSTEPRTLRSDLVTIRRAAFRATVARLRVHLSTVTTARRLFLTAIATFVPLLVVAVLLNAALSRTAHLTGEVSAEVETLVAPVLELSDDLAETRVLLDRYFTSGADHDRAAFEAYARRIDSEFESILGVTGLSQAQVQTDALAARDSWHFIRDMVTAREFELPADPAERNALFATLSSTISSIRRDLVDVADVASERIVTLANSAEETASRMRLLLFTLIPAAFLSGSYLVGGLVRDLRRGTRELREAAEALDQGRYDRRITENVHGDLAPVARSFNAMAERIERQAQELHATANRDELTGVMNRRGFQTDLASELERAVRYERPAALLLLDVDHFKHVNDTYGHPAGDVVLRAVADEIQDAVRGVDRVGRWGGEEFAILLPETPRGDAEHVANRVNRVIRQRVVITEGEAIRVTASIGVAVYDPALHGIITPDELMQHADDALYEAKDAGRDRVVFAS